MTPKKVVVQKKTVFTNNFFIDFDNSNFRRISSSRRVPKPFDLGIETISAAQYGSFHKVGNHLTLSFWVHSIFMYYIVF